MYLKMNIISVVIIFLVLSMQIFAAELSKEDLNKIKQYRFGTDKIELEIPGGIIEPEESPKDGAIRELKEETGYSVKSVKQIGFVDANPAIMNNRVFTFLAELSNKGKVEFDPDEEIESEFAAPAKIKQYLREGKITNAYVVDAFLWYILHENNILLNK